MPNLVDATAAPKRTTATNVPVNCQVRHTPDWSPGEDETYRISFFRLSVYLFMHLGCLGVIWVGFSWTAAAVAFALYLVRIFFVTGFYHRYFSHRAFRTNRFWQFIFGLCANSCAQNGPLWWASNHRHHHGHSDLPEDAHSPCQHGLFWSHMGWLIARSHPTGDHKRVSDLARYPELRILDTHWYLVPVLLAVGLYFFGSWLGSAFPATGTSGPQMLVWGFFISTVFLFHITCTINSLAHVFGSRRFNSKDDSRNNFWLALLTFGEGWHNNHHHYPSSARQGFYWWEIDITYYILRAMASVGIIWDLRPVPEHVLQEGHDHG